MEFYFDGGEIVHNFFELGDGTLPALKAKSWEKVNMGVKMNAHTIR